MLASVQLRQTFCAVQRFSSVLFEAQFLRFPSAAGATCGSPSQLLRQLTGLNLSHQEGTVFESQRPLVLANASSPRSVLLYVEIDPSNS